MENATWTIGLATIGYALLTAIIAFFAYRAFSEARKQTREIAGTRWSGYFLEYTKRYDEIWGRMPACVTDDPLAQNDWFNGREEYVCNRVGESLGPIGVPIIHAEHGSEALVEHARRRTEEELRETYGQLKGQGYFSVDHGELLRITDMYFNLCSEEYHLAGKGELEEEAWRIWKAGIKQNMDYMTLRSAWQKRREQYKYYGDFKNWMDDLIAADANKLDGLNP
ncbi:hypothetical protein J7J84_02365 [bacterium]|nr:hypothetical protein [bacterium]